MACQNTHNSSSCAAALPSEREQLLDCFDGEYSPLVALAKQIGPEAIDKLLSELGGTKPHLPTSENFWSQLRREVRNESIRAQFRGDNIHQLSLETGLCERQIRAIVNSNVRQYRRAKEAAKAVHVPDSAYDPYANLAMVYGVSVRALLACVLENALESEDVRKALEQEFGAQMALPMAAA